MVALTIRKIELLTKKDSPLSYPKLEMHIFMFNTDIIKSQYHGDVVVPFLRTVTLNGEHGSCIRKNFERPHYVPLNKKMFGTIIINIKDEAADLFAIEHGKVIITLHFRCSISFEMVFPLTRLDSMGYDNDPSNT